MELGGDGGAVVQDSVYFMAVVSILSCGFRKPDWANFGDAGGVMTAEEWITLPPMAFGCSSS